VYILTIYYYYTQALSTSLYTNVYTNYITWPTITLILLHYVDLDTTNILLLPTTTTLYTKTFYHLSTVSFWKDNRS